MTTTTPATSTPAPYVPYRVTSWWQGRKSSTTFGTREAARAYADSLRKSGVRRVFVAPV